MGDPKTSLAQFQKALPYFNESPKEKASIQKEIQDLTPSKKDMPPPKKDSK